MVGRWGDEGHAGGGVAGPGDPGIDLLAGQVPALAGLGPLGHLDLDLRGAHQVLAGHAEAARGHLFDGGVARRVTKPLRLLAPLAGVGLAPQQVHGPRHALVGLLGDGAVAHGAGLEALDDGVHALHLFDGDGLVQVLHLHQTPEGVGLGLVVHQGGVLLEQLIVPPAHRLLEQVDGLGVVHVVLLAGAGLVGAQAVQCEVGVQPQGVEGPGVVAVHQVLDLLQADAPHPGNCVGEVGVDDLSVDADGLEDLGRLVGLKGGNAHFGGDLHDAVEHRLVVGVHRRVVVLVQQAVGDEAVDGLIDQIGVDGPGSVAQEGGEVVDLPGLGGLQHDGHRGALLGADQVLLDGRDRQQGRDGHVVLVHPPVGEDDDVGPLAPGPVHRHEESVQGLLEGGVFVVEDGNCLHLEAGFFHAPDLHQVGGGEDGVVDLEDPAVLRPLLQQVAVVPQIDGGVGDDLLPDGVDGRVGDLGEELLEVVEEGLALVVQHRQGDVDAHGGGGLGGVPGHGEDGGLHVFIGVAEGLLDAGQLLPGVGLHPVVGDGQVPQPHQVPVQPLAVGRAGGVPLLDLVVPDDPAGRGVHQQHLARLQPGLAHDALRRDVQHPHLGGEDELVVAGDVVPAGAQAVAVQHRAHAVPVGEEDRGRAVPGLHQDGVVLVEVPLGAGDGLVVAPGLGQGDHDRQGQLHAAHHQELQGVVQHGRVGAVHVHHRQHLVHVRGQHPRGHGLLPGQHPVDVAPDGVDLPVVEDKAVGVGPLPGGVGVGGEAGVDQGDGALVVPVLEVGVEPAQLVDQEHALVDDGPAGQGGHIGALAPRLLEHPPGHIELPVKIQPPAHAGRPLHKPLLDAGHLGQGLVAQDGGLHGHGAPAQELHALLLHDDLEHLLGLAPLQGVLGEEEHAHAVVPLLPQGEAQVPHGLGEEGVGDLDQDAHAVAGLALGVLARPVLQLFHDLQRVVHRLVGLAAVDVHHRADAAGIVLKGRVVEAPPHAALSSGFQHVVSPLSGCL